MFLCESNCLYRRTRNDQSNAKMFNECCMDLFGMFYGCLMDMVWMRQGCYSEVLVI